MSLLSRATFGIFLNSNCKSSIITPIYINSYIFKQSYCLVPRVFKCTSENSGSHLENSTAEKNDNLRSQYVPFEQMVTNRRKEARRSIIVQVSSEKSCAELHAYCSLFGFVKGIYHYSLPEPLHFALVEFQDENDVKHIMEVCRHMNTNKVIPAVSPLLWFRAKDSSGSTNIKLPAKESSSDSPSLPLVSQNWNSAPSKVALRKMLLNAETFSQQITMLYNATQLNDVGVRLRFLTARQLELTLSGLFPRANVLPFGSSVNGFGRHGCDLDVTFNFDDEVQVDKDFRLVFHAKSSLAQNRAEVQRQMELLSDLCEQFLPGCGRVKRILQARVPIIKYKQELMDVECDVSMTNRCAIYMSELLYIYGSIDYRVRPLVFAVRCWAREVGLVCPTPGQWITNFALTLLVLFFLQNIKVLPPLQMLVSRARQDDKRITSDGVNCTFLRDIGDGAALTPSAPSDDLESLMSQFFNYYATFDFGSKAVSLASGVPVLKPDHSPLYIVNPLENSLNVSKNVSVEETERFKIELANATWNLDVGSDVEMSPNTSWGLVSLFESGKNAVKTRNVPRTQQHQPPIQRLVLQTLFKDGFARDPDSVLNNKNSTGHDRNNVSPVPIVLQEKVETKQKARKKKRHNGKMKF